MSTKTEQPTPKKLRDARRRGEVPRSRELVAGAGLVAAAVALGAYGPALARGLGALFTRILASVEDPSRAAPGKALVAAASTGAALLAPIVLAILLAATAVAFVQVGALFAPARVAPRLDRLDPAAGFGRIFAKRTVVELLKSLLVLAVVAGVVADLVVGELRGVASAPLATPSELLASTGALVAAVTLRAGAALLALGVLDFFYQRHRHHADLRMTKEEVKREHRESEGDPRAKQRRRRMHQEIVEHGVLEAVRRADVLVVNPTHYAVALAFDRDGEQEAPEVLAKGLDHLARRMIDAAREAGVPVLRDVPLAHALYELEVGDAIPEDLYEAVAAILQLAWAEREGNAP